MGGVRKRIFMKMWILKQTYVVFLDAIKEVYLFNEYLKNGEGRESCFAYGKGTVTGFGFHLPEMPEICHDLPKANSLLQAQANLIEEMIHNNCQLGLTNWVDGTFPNMLMVELGKENLPLLLDFFTDKYAVKAFDTVLKN